MLQTWDAPYCERPFTATVRIPGSKSMTNRALVLAALAEGRSTLRGWLQARDTALMIAGLQVMGTTVTQEEEALVVHGGNLTGPATVDCGLAGTVMRFLPPVAAMATGDIRFTGDPQAAIRPLAPMLAALRGLGAAVDGDVLPFTVHGAGGLRGGIVTLDASASSQFVSGLLLSGAAMQRGLELRHVGPPLPSTPHIEMTVAMLAEVGVTVFGEGDQWLVERGVVAPHDWAIEPDLSNAGPFLAAAMVTGGRVSIPHWPADTTQAGDELRTIFGAMGGTAELTADGLTLQGPDSIRALTADLCAVGELLPTVAAVAAFADGPSHLTGLAHVRGHETDRLRALATELGRLGATVTELPDGLVITPGPMVGTVVECYDDHRMATFAAIIGLRIPGVSLSDVGTTTKTMPDFPGLWTSLVRPGAGVGT